MCFLNGFHLISPAFLTGSRNAGRSQYAVNCRDDDNDPDPEEVDSHPLTTFTREPGTGPRNAIQHPLHFVTAHPILDVLALQ